MTAFPEPDEFTRKRLAALDAAWPEDETECETCGENDPSTTYPCKHRPLLQMCEYCHLESCPDGGDCYSMTPSKENQ